MLMVINILILAKNFGIILIKIGDLIVLIKVR